MTLDLRIWAVMEYRNGWKLRAWVLASSATKALQFYPGCKAMDWYAR